MSESSSGYAISLVLITVVLFYMVRKLDDENHSELPNWATTLLKSNVGIGIQVIVSLTHFVSLGSLVGIILWVLLKGVADMVMGSSAIFRAAIVGATLSPLGFGIFAVILGLLGPILSMVYEEWTAYIAPVIGGTVGAAISSGLPTNVIYIVALSALTGGIALVLYDLVMIKESVTLKRIGDLVIAGVGFGVVNGVIEAIAFKVLEVTVGLGWLLAIGTPHT